MKVCHLIHDVRLWSRLLRRCRGTKLYLESSMGYLESLKITRPRDGLETLILLFKAGMCMRQWRGDTEPYPHTEDETLGLDPIRIMFNVSHALKAFQSAPQSAFVLGLRTVSSGRIEHETIRSVHEKIITDKVCIRLTSRRLIEIVDFYARELYGYMIPGLRMQDVVVVG